MKKVALTLLGLVLAISLSISVLAATPDTVDTKNSHIDFYNQFKEVYEIDEEDASGEESETRPSLSSTIDQSTLRIGTGTWSENDARSELVLPNTEPRYEDAFLTSRVLTIHVDVNCPLETQWRNEYSDSYYYEANRIVEKVDDYLCDEFGIDFYTIRHPHWSFSTSSTGETAVKAAINDVIDNYGIGNGDLMIAFAGPIGDSGSSGIFGATYKGYPYCILFDHGYSQNCKSMQHEVGHAYGLDECDSNVACVMRQGPDGSWIWFNNLCSSDHTQWDYAKQNYGS